MEYKILIFILIFKIQLIFAIEISNLSEFRQNIVIPLLSKLQIVDNYTIIAECAENYEFLAWNDTIYEIENLVFDKNKGKISLSAIKLKDMIVNLLENLVHCRSYTGEKIQKWIDMENLEISYFEIMQKYEQNDTEFNKILQNLALEMRKAENNKNKISDILIEFINKIL